MTMNEQEQLEKEYCPPLDPALISAILSDFDLTSASNIASARAILDQLNESAAAEEATGFDPSGSSSQVFVTEKSSDGTLSESRAQLTVSGDTDSTSISQGSLGVKSPEASHTDAIEDAARDTELIDQLDTLTKISLLKEIFPSVSEATISHTLQKSDGKWNVVIENLLNLEFFESETSVGEERINSKGIDAFAEEYQGRRTRKGKSNKQKLKWDTSGDVLAGTTSQALSSRQFNAWEAGREEISYISSHLNVPYQTVSSVYYANGASLKTTITNLLQSASRPTPLSSDEEEIVQVHALDLSDEFPALPPSLCAILLRHTYPSTASAHELAKVLIKPEIKRSGAEPITAAEIRAALTPTYAPLSDLSNDDGLLDHPTLSRALQPPRNGISAAARLASYSQAYNLALAQCRKQSTTRYHIVGSARTSSPAAAGYYAQRARELAALRAEAALDVATERVDTQSQGLHRGNTIDLHGVTVREGVTIARQATEMWYAASCASLGARKNGARVRGLDGRFGPGDGVDDTDNDRDTSFHIVVGRGRHSAGGVAKVGPAVRKMLIAEGWDVSDEQGVLVVFGKKS